MCVTYLMIIGWCGGGDLLTFVGQSGGGVRKKRETEDKRGKEGRRRRIEERERGGGGREGKEEVGGKGGSGKDWGQKKKRRDGLLMKVEVVQISYSNSLCHWEENTLGMLLPFLLLLFLLLFFHHVQPLLVLYNTTLHVSPIRQYELSLIPRTVWEQGYYCRTMTKYGRGCQSTK